MCLRFCKTKTTVELTEKRRELLAACRVTVKKKRWEVDGMTVVSRARPVLKSYKSYSQSPGIQPVAAAHGSHALEKETSTPSPRGVLSNWTHWTGVWLQKKKRKTRKQNNTRMRATCKCTQTIKPHWEMHTEEKKKQKTASRQEQSNSTDLCVQICCGQVNRLFRWRGRWASVAK